jgi:2-polyprenyl-3-methyl-5-hydroxy-6-metoxy-1,4-benzoquinol methylase
LPAVHGPDEILRVLRGAPGRRLFEASCGTGKLTRELVQHGFEVTASTFGDSQDLGPGVTCAGDVYLNLDLPLPDEAFDCAVLQEVIEHLDNHAHVVREFQRILRPGGWWVLTTPNATGVRSRVHYLLTGFVKGRRRPAHYGSPPGAYRNLFIPALPVLHYLWWQYGFRVQSIGRANRKLSSWFLFLLLYPFLWLWTMRYARPMAKYDSPVQGEACRELRRMLLHPAILMDENLVLVLVKSGPAADYWPERARSSHTTAIHI